MAARPVQGSSGPARARWPCRAGAAGPLLPLLLSLACHASHRLPVRPERSLDVPGVTRFHFVSSSAGHFASAEGTPCGSAPREVRDGLFGWQGPGELPACRHDTFEQGQAPGWLELRWAAAIPADGDWLVTPGIFGLGAWGKVTARSAPQGRFTSEATVLVEARAPSCRGEWSLSVARTQATNSWPRTAEYAGAVELEEILLRGCRAGEPVELRLRFVGESNRGRIDVAWFGFSAYATDDADQLFGLRPGPERPPSAR